jgi:hypothetical protein
VNLRALMVTFGMGVLVAGTVLVFRAFDAQSHSASDTLRPFVLTIAAVCVRVTGEDRHDLR